MYNAMKQLALLIRKSSSTATNNVTDAYLCHREHIKLPFDNVNSVFFLNLLPGLVQTENIFTLGKKNGISRILILGFLVDNRPTCVTGYLPGLGVIGKHDALPKGVFQSFFLHPNILIRRRLYVLAYILGI